MGKGTKLALLCGTFTTAACQPGHHTPREAGEDWLCARAVSQHSDPMSSVRKEGANERKFCEQPSGKHPVQSAGSDGLELGNNQHAHCLVKGAADAEPPLVRTPVQTRDGLSGQGHILQEADGTCNSHLYSFRIFL